MVHLGNNLSSKGAQSIMITAFLNLKGGCGKSTSSVHLCRYWMDLGYTVALIDADAQGTSSAWIHNLASDLPRPRLFRIVEPDPLMDEMSNIVQHVDQVVVDGAGGLAEVQRAILLLSDLVAIPVQPSIPDISASHEAIKAVRRARQIRQNLPKAVTFLTRVAPKTLLQQEAREVLGEYDDIPLLKTEIPQRQVVADAMGQGLTLFDYKGNRGATDVANCYRHLFQEMGCG